MGNADMKTNQTGFSLVEMMVAMTISLVLVLGVATIMISSKRSYNVQQDMARMQENARFAIEFLNKDLRMAGYFGCSFVPPMGVMPLEGRDNVNRANLSSDSNPSDVILVRFVDTNRNAFSVVAPPAPATNPLQEGQINFTPTVRGDLFIGDTVIASDCGSSEAYTITNITNNNIFLTRVNCRSLLTSNGLCKTYNNKGLSDGAEIRRLVFYRYFIGSTNDGGFSLFRDINPINATLDINNADELIQGVENMQIRYGVDTDPNIDGVANQYQTANNIIDWTRIVSVRIYLVVNTIKERFDKEPDTETYDVGEDQDYDPQNDHRRRTIFTTTVMLRN
jgi:type IV pilus assembly protein PilW